MLGDRQQPAGHAPLLSAPGAFPSGPLERAGRLFMQRCCKLRVTTKAPFPNAPFMVCANHRSHTDSVAIMTALGLPFSACGLIAAEDYFFTNRAKLSVISRVLTLIPISRQPTPRAFKKTVAKCERFVADGGQVLVSYPEGTRNTSDGLKSFKRGPAALAIRLGLCILPGFIDGTDRVMPKGQLVPRCNPVTVHFGTPINANAMAGSTNFHAVSSALTSLVQEQVSNLAGMRYSNTTPIYESDSKLYEG
ncbi:MAG: lysophospholipid acyltransferase family protein [Proteobacteria bacterium]|nr:lysophospholipid acyltransferase family protein [Pseudomonadota bacterium]